MFKRLIGIDNNPKTIKGQGEEYKIMTGILYLAPEKLSGVMNACPFASKGCAAACLNTAGRGVYTKTQLSRINKTRWLKADKPAFISRLIKDITWVVNRANKLGFTPAIRLNGTSDLPFENMGIMQKFPNVQFYDYTKSEPRMLKWLEGKMPSNYHLTFSRSEDNGETALRLAKMGANVAVVFNTAKLPKTYKGIKVINGDKHDIRFLDKPRVIVGLKAKGKAKRDTTGFVVKVRGT
jgi:hypothetical protein